MSFAEIGLDLARTHIFGILNVTPDSFSDGGNFLDPEQAILQAKKLKNEGADVIDVGGESTRPGAVRISAQEELKRVLPVVEALSSENYLVSIDTTRAEVAEAAVIAGAKIVNDVSGGRSDPLMFKKVSDLNVAYILMHWRAQSKQMDNLAIYKDVINEVAAEINSQIALALAAGIKKEN
jgi:dihydropteroate synthase